MALDKRISLNELDQLCIEKLEDVELEFEHSARGELLRQTKRSVTRSTITGEHPPEQEMKRVDIVTGFAYNKRSDCYMNVLPNNQREYTIHDARGQVIGVVGVERDAFDEGETRVSVIPFTVYLLNAHGQRAVSMRYYYGADEIIWPKHEGRLMPLPMPKQIYPTQDQVSCNLFDGRGLVSVAQKANGTLSYKTYQSSKDEVRHFSVLTNLERSAQAEVKQVVRIDEKRKKYDDCNRVEKSKYYRDNNLQESFQFQFNAFGETVAQGDKDSLPSALPLYQRYDNAGRGWADNRKSGKPVIHFRDLTGKETVQLHSSQVDLSTQEYKYLPDLLDK